MIFRCGPATVELGADGAVSSVVHDAHPGHSYLAGVVIRAVVIGGRAVPVGQPDVLADEDEVELVHTVTDRLRLVVRHTFAAGWGLRIAFSDLGGPDGEPIVLDGVELVVEPGPELLGWVLAAGAAAAYSLQVDRGGAPLLGGSLQLGSIAKAGTGGLQLGRIELTPGGRYVVAWHWDWYANPYAFGGSRHLTVPTNGFVTVGESIEIGRDDDAALVVSDSLEVTESEDHLELVSDDPGRFEIEQRSARGTTHLDLQWVPATWRPP